MAMKAHGFESDSAVPATGFTTPVLSGRDLIRAALLAGTSAALGPVFSFAQTAASELTPAQRGQDDSKVLADGNWKPAVNGSKYDGEMISLDLTDQQASDVLNYVRNSWGNKGEAVRPEEVAPQRKKKTGE